MKVRLNLSHSNENLCNGERRAFVSRGQTLRLPSEYSLSVRVYTHNHAEN
jgi:hypothetical protein